MAKASIFMFLVTCTAFPWMPVVPLWKPFAWSDRVDFRSLSNFAHRIANFHVFVTQITGFDRADAKLTPACRQVIIDSNIFLHFDKINSPGENATSVTFGMKSFVCEQIKLLILISWLIFFTLHPSNISIPKRSHKIASCRWKSRYRRGTFLWLSMHHHSGR